MIESDSKIQFLVKRSFETLPIFSKLRDKDSKSAKSIIGSFENITKEIGAFRNSYGTLLLYLLNLLSEK
jgi:hypothetical protein